MNSNAVSAVALTLLAILIVLFAGTPNLHDLILARMAHCQ